MATAAFFREKADQCRTLLQVAQKPEVIAQLEIWAREFEEIAAEMERTGPSVLIVTSRPAQKA